MGSSRNAQDQLTAMALTYELEVHRALLGEYGTHPEAAAFLAVLEFLAEQEDDGALDFKWNDVKRAALQDRLVATTNAEDAEVHAQRLWHLLQKNKTDVEKIRNARGDLRRASLMYLRSWPLYGSIEFAVDTLTLSGEDIGPVQVIVSGTGLRVCRKDGGSIVLLEASMSDIATIAVMDEVAVKIEVR